MSTLREPRSCDNRPRYAVSYYDQIGDGREIVYADELARLVERLHEADCRISDVVPWPSHFDEWQMAVESEEHLAELELVEAW